MEKDSTKRFSNRVENYVKYRPGYPPAILDFLREACGLTPAAVIADIGSGTGILAELFLRQGNVVLGVEPNKEMREAAEDLLRGYPNFTSVAGTAEATTLAEDSIDFVTAGQAFHWFDPVRARTEFKRILKPGGFVVLVWNERNIEDSPFMSAYESLLGELGASYHDVKQRGSEDDVGPFLGGKVQVQSFENEQLFDFTGLKGRLLSSSYAPLPGHPQYEAMITKLRRLFDTFQEGGRVRFVYRTRLYWGQIRRGQ